MIRSRLAAALGAVGVALVSAACASHAALPARLRAWENGSSYSSDQHYISTDIGEIATGIRTGPVKAVRTACDGLGVDAANAYGELPTPDQSLTSDLNGEYLTATNAAQSCSAASSLRGGRIRRYLTLVVRVEADMRAARARIASIFSG